MVYRHRVLMPEVVRPFALIVVVGVLTLPIGTLRGAKDLFFIFSGVSIALVIRSASVRPWLIVSSLAITLLTMIAQNPDAVTSLDFDVAASKSTFEGSISFVFGLLAVWAIAHRRWGVAIFALLLTILTLKRIAVLGVILCCLLWVLPKHWLRILLHPIVLTVANAIAIIGLIAYATGDLDRWIIGSLSQSANALGQGRQALLAGVASEIIGAPTSFILFGRGPGAAYETLTSVDLMSIGMDPMLHCDVLKILYDYGAIVFGAFFYLLYKTEDLQQKLLCLYVNITFLSDNTLVYHFLLMFFVLFAIGSDRRQVRYSAGRTSRFDHAMTR